MKCVDSGKRKIEGGKHFQSSFEAPTLSSRGNSLSKIFAFLSSAALFLS
jgi:hypothetical protein